MISVIVCSRKEPSWDIHKRNVARTIGADFEYVRIDNSQNKFGICAAYNLGVAQSRGDILVFVHEDCVFLENGWGAVLAQKFAADDRIGMVGVAGTQYLFEDVPAWVKAGMPFVKGRVLHDIDAGQKFVMTVFSWEEGDFEVVALDGLFFAVRRSLFEQVRFDDVNFNRFHFYDLDICMQVRRTHKIIVTTDIIVKHFSGGQFNNDWQAGVERFKAKYRGQLPAACTDLVPDVNNRQDIQSFDVKGKIPQVVPI
ncbi:MAG: glycosyltransferase [Chitinivibrionales bacterium]|nr:glycosyltransferase [Chitinivibrionales bacterium]